MLLPCTRELQSPAMGRRGGLSPRVLSGTVRQSKGEPVNCREGCGACCIAPSISSPIPGMPAGKPAGARCAQLTPENQCRVFGRPERPAVCGSLRPSAEMCGANRDEALAALQQLEQLTRG